MSKVTLTWTQVANATTYSVYRAGVLLASGLVTTSYTDVSVVPIQSYTYTVTASNAAGESAHSSTKSISTPPGILQFSTSASGQFSRIESKSRRNPYAIKHHMPNIAYINAILPPGLVPPKPVWNPEPTDLIGITVPLKININRTYLGNNGNGVQITLTSGTLPSGWAFDGTYLTYDGVTVDPSPALIQFTATTRGGSSISSAFNVQGQTGSGGSFTYPSAAVLRTAGYIMVVEDFGAVPDGVTDCTTAIQNAINAGHTQGKPLWFDLGTYIISSWLHAYIWINSSLGDPGGYPHNFQGASYNPNTGLPQRPVIKLAASAPAFDSQVTPMLMCNCYLANSTGQTVPAETFDPLSTPSGFTQNGVSGMFSRIDSINFDTSGHSQAAGLYWNLAQGCMVTNVSVTSTGSYASFIGLPGAGGTSVNISGNGGQFGVALQTNRGGFTGGSSGVTICGLTLTNHTSVSLVPGDFCPLTVCGFDLEPAGSGLAYQPAAGDVGNGPEFDTAVLQDGKVVQTNGLMFNNTIGGGVTLYLRNVYCSGSTSLVRSGTNATIAGAGTWSLINEYSACSQNNNNLGNTPFPTFSLNQGTLIGTLEQIVNVTQNSAPPPADIVARHVPSVFYNIDNGPYIDITSQGASRYSNGSSVEGNLESFFIYAGGSTGQHDSTAAIQAALDAAQTAGHGRVLVPWGMYQTSSTITLHSNNHLFGLSNFSSGILPLTSWAPTTGNPPIISTDSNTEGTTTIGNLIVTAPQENGALSSGVWTGNRFVNFFWNMGRKSYHINVVGDNAFPAQALTTNGGNTRYIYQFGTTGGGRFWMIDGPNAGGMEFSTGFRNFLIQNTTQPLWIYGANCEINKASNSGGSPDCSFEINNAQNVRIFNLKRESHSTIVIVKNNSNNVALFGGGNLGGSGLNSAFDSFYVIDSTATNTYFIQGTYLFTDSSDTTLLDQKTSQTLGFQVNLCTYQRGSINDAAMSIN